MTNRRKILAQPDDPRNWLGQSAESYDGGVVDEFSGSQGGPDDWFGTPYDGECASGQRITSPTEVASVGLMGKLKQRIGRRLLTLGASCLAGAALLSLVGPQVTQRVFAEKDVAGVLSQDVESDTAPSSVLTSPYELPSASPNTITEFVEMSEGHCSVEVIKTAAELYEGVFQEELPSNYEDLEPLINGALLDYKNARDALVFVDLGQYPDFKDLYLDANSAEPKMPIDQYKTLLTLVLAEVDINVEFPASGQMDKTTEDSLRKAVMGVVTAVSEMPKMTINNTSDDTELEDGSVAGIKTIKLSANPQDFVKSGKDTVAYVYLTGDVNNDGSVSGSYHTMTINITHPTASIMSFKHAGLHEFGHINHADSAKSVSPASNVFKYCITTGFKGANPPDFVYGSSARSSMSNIQSPFGAVTGFLDPNKQVVTISPYGATTVTEDVAEVAYAASSPNRGYDLFELQSDNTAVVYKKLSLYIAQMIAEHPESNKQLTKYFTSLLRLQHMKEIAQAKAQTNDKEAMRIVGLVNQTLAPTDYTGVG